MKRSLPILLAAILVAAAGCSGGDDRIMAVHLVDHFDKNGFKGRFQRENAEQIGAEEAGRFRGEGFDVELAKFDSEAKARGMQRNGFNGFPCYAHGRYVMLVRNATEPKKLVKVFREY